MEVRFRRGFIHDLASAEQFDSWLHIMLFVTNKGTKREYCNQVE
jgi:hypothetical protein